MYIMLLKRIAGFIGRKMHLGLRVSSSELRNEVQEEYRMQEAYQESAKVFKALGDPNRLQILEMLQTGEKCACKLLEALQISQPTLSHHMKILCDAGLVRGRKEGKWVHYSLIPEGTVRAKELLDQCLDGQK